jgi:hypothetical protein
MAKSPPKSAKPTGRSARLAEALRANLKRRKAQAKSRAATAPNPDETKKG